MALLRFTKWRPSAILDFNNLQFLSCGLCRDAILLLHTKFRRNRKIVDELGSISDVVYQISLKSDNFTLRYGDLAIFKMAVVRYLGFAMTSQYCIAGHIFVVQILVLKFHVDRCYSFRDTCNIVILGLRMRCIT